MFNLIFVETICFILCISFSSIVTVSSNSEFQCDISRNQLQSYADSEYNEQYTTITLTSGNKVGDKLNSQTAGRYGPVLLQDRILIEEIAHFDRERIPERVVHAKGGGAFGFFVVTHPEIQKYSKATVFDQVGKKTPLFVRFSQAASALGSQDTVREVRGFAIKFYTDSGLWDLVGNNTPLFFIRDPILFPQFVHTQKRNPKTHLTDPNAIWDFLSLREESIHQVSFSFSDRGIPDGWRFMNGFGANTFKLVNERNEAFYCKFHYLSNQGIRNLDPETAQWIAGNDPDYNIRDLYNAIEAKQYPSWTLYVQVMTFEEAKQFRYNPFDVTKIWPHKEFPLIQVGQIVLNKNPGNHFAQVEQVAFDPANMPDGIEPSPDKMLQGRIFSYFDTQRYRLGTNFFMIPINRPTVETVTPTIRDGKFVFDDNKNGAPNYYPNSFSRVKTNLEFKETRYRIDGPPDVDRFDSSDEDNFSQVRVFWEQTLNEDERQRLVQNIAMSLKDAEPLIQKRMVKVCSKVHIDYGTQLLHELQRLRGNSTSCYSIRNR